MSKPAVIYEIMANRKARKLTSRERKLVCQAEFHVRAPVGKSMQKAKSELARAFALARLDGYEVREHE
jgi:hypothetical protein